MSEQERNAFAFFFENREKCSNKKKQKREKFDVTRDHPKGTFLPQELMRPI